MSKHIINFYENLIYILDDHLISSEYMGEDEYGRKKFDNKRTKVGEALYKLKYDTNAVGLQYIIDEVYKDLKQNNLLNINFVVPAPYTKYRKIQPVCAICDLLAQKLNCNYAEALKKLSKNQAKDKQFNLQNDIHCIDNSLWGNVLLIDDFYSTGNTIKKCINELKQNNNILNVYTVCITKTKG